MLKRRLDLDEDQSDIADHAITDVRKSVREFVESVQDSRQELAEALRDEALDDARLEVVFDRLDEDLKRTRRDVVSAVKQVHAVLDDEQREQAATWLAGARWA
jgi:DNA repair ATPase RecN